MRLTFSEILERLLEPQTRSGHLQIIGPAGSGKSKLLEQMIKNDIQNNKQLCLIDPHSYLYADMLAWCRPKGHKVLSFDCQQSQWTNYDDFIRIMDHKWTLANLTPSSLLSQVNAQLLASFIINHIYITAQSREIDSPYPYYLYIDSCEFLAKSLIPIIKQGRKFNLNLILTLQTFGQLKQAGEHAYQSIMANTKTKVALGNLSPKDTKLLADYDFIEEIKEPIK